jgi:hypothetical protein
MNYLQLEFYKLQAPAKIYVHKIAENFHNNLKDNSCDITLWELLTKCETITCITNSSDELSWLPIAFISLFGGDR